LELSQQPGKEVHPQSCYATPLFVSFTNTGIGPIHDMQIKYVCGRKMQTQTPPTKQPENFQADIYIYTKIKT